jgi:hypothetical protein
MKCDLGLKSHDLYQSMQMWKNVYRRDYVELKQGIMNMTNIYICMNWTSLQWQNMALSQVTGLSSK